jgi:hypothetical protein
MMDIKEAFIRKKISKQRYAAQCVRGIEWGLSTERLVREVLADPVCQLSGEPLVFEPDYIYTFSIDRKDSSKGYTHDNVQWVGVSVNTAKSNLLDEDFVDMCISVAKHRAKISAEQKGG